MPSSLDVVCIVEDDAAVRNALKFALETEGLTVQVFDGAVSFLNERHMPPFGCLVVDYRMPVMDGLELTAALRERGLTTPTIMITGRSNKELRARAARLGIVEVIDKPLSDRDLVDTIKSALSASVH
jgi:FixJ family two-component response regulator